MVVKEASAVLPSAPGRYYDHANQRLIYVGEAATARYWDQRWRDGIAYRLETAARKGSYVSRITRRFLAPNAGPVLEGGCGSGQHVAALVSAGYHCVGVDYAEQTVGAVNAIAPHLDVRAGNVTRLDFPDAHFAAYWSLGVIEHFWHGYESVAQEMARVIREGGFLFLSFPYLSPLRRFKAGRRQYPTWIAGDTPPDHFYQFALSDRHVVEHFHGLGFRLVNRIPWDGIKGVKDELTLFQPALQRLYDYQGGSTLVRGARYLLSKLMAAVAGHVIILVFKREAA